MNIFDVGYWNARYLLAGLNFCLCGAIGVIVLCRINVLSAKTTKKVTRYAYSMLFLTAACSGLSPFFSEWPGWSVIVGNSALIFFLWSGRSAWKNGQLPEFAKSDEAPLDQLPPERRT